MADVDIGDVMLAIAHRVSTNLEATLKLAEPKGLRAILQGAAKIMTTEIEFVDAGATVGGVGVSANAEGEFSLSLGIGKLTAKAKNDATLRDRLNNYLGQKKTSCWRPSIQNC